MPYRNHEARPNFFSLYHLCYLLKYGVIVQLLCCFESLLPPLSWLTHIITFGSDKVSTVGTDTFFRSNPAQVFITLLILIN